MSADQGRGRRTRIDASHVIAYDERAGAHRYLRDGTVVVEGDRVVHVGKGFAGRADETIDARGRIVAPGFVNVHAHLAGSPLDKSFLEDRGSRQFYLSGLFAYNTRYIAAGAVLMTLPTIAVFLALQRYFLRGITIGAVK